MENIFLTEFNKLGMSYSKWGKAIGGYSKNTTYSWINNPTRLGLTTALFIGSCLNIEPEKAAAYWKALKMAQHDAKYDGVIEDALK